MSPRIGPRYLSIADQGLNSVSNFALVAFTAIASTTAEFGHFAIVYAFFVFFLGAQRSLVGETALVHDSAPSSRGDGAPVGARRRGIVGASLVVALPAAAVLAVIAAFVPADARGVWLVFSAATFVAIVQDALRYAVLAEHRPHLALVLDVVWTLPALVAMALLSARQAGAEAIGVAWGASALLSAVVGCLILRTGPDLVAGVRWLQRRRGPAVRYFVEFASLNGSTLAVWVLLVPLIGAVGVGALRGAQLLFSPLNTVFTALRIAMIPELIRAEPSRYRRRLAELAGILAVAAVVWGGAIMLMNANIGTAILGSTWLQAQELRGAFLAQYLLLAGYTLILTVFRTRKLDNSSSIMRGVLAVLTLALPLLFGVAGLALGAAWGLAAAVGGAALTGAVLLACHRRRRED